MSLSMLGEVQLSVSFRRDLMSSKMVMRKTISGRGYRLLRYLAPIQSHSRVLALAGFRRGSGLLVARSACSIPSCLAFAECCSRVV